jgi:hypothetical protein
MRSAQRRRPALAQVVEIRLAGFDAEIQLRLAGVAVHDQHIDRQPDRQMRVSATITTPSRTRIPQQ